MESFDGFLVQLAVQRSTTIEGTNRNRQMVGKNADQRARFSRKAWKKGWTRGLQSRQMSDREGSIKNARSFFPCGSPTYIYIYPFCALFGENVPVEALDRRGFYEWMGFLHKGFSASFMINAVDCFLTYSDT